MTSTIEFEHDFPVAPSAVIAHREQDMRRAPEAFWPVTCYDAQTRSEVATAQEKAALRSLFEDIAHG